MKKMISLGLTVLFLTTGESHAQTFAHSATNVSAGEKRAATCFSCHNDNGISKIPGIPHLAGQRRDYLENALRAYRSGQRQDPTMDAMAKPLSDEDIANIAAYFSLQIPMNAHQSAADTLAMVERIRPPGTLIVHPSSKNQQNSGGHTDTTNRSEPLSGFDVYNKHCSVCHNTGAANAPKVGNADAWNLRIRQGREILIQHALQGFNGMPAKGGCTTCSDKEIEAAVDYISRQSQ